MLHKISYIFPAAILMGFLQLLPQLVLSQKGTQKADALYSKMMYSKAVVLYEKAAKSNISLAHSEARTADCYRRLGDLRQAEYWYSKAVMEPESNPELKFEYATVLETQGKYQLAKDWYLKYADASPAPQKGFRFADACSRVKELFRDSLQWSIRPVPLINSMAREICPVPYQGGIIFSANRKAGIISQEVNGTDFTPFYDVYFAPPSTSPDPEKMIVIKGAVNSLFHDGPVCFSPDGNTAYITRSNLTGKDLQRGASGVNRLSVVTAVKVNGLWKGGEYLPLNSLDYSVAHPALSPDGNVLFFSSDMPGGYGGWDLYMARKTDGKWGEAVNMGAYINTESDEVFPVMTGDETLPDGKSALRFSFASSRAESMGGLDIFFGRYSDGSFEITSHPGHPLNSFADDFSLVLDSTRRSGYFSSNRPGGAGGDDIYHFVRHPKVEITVEDSRTAIPVSQAEVVVQDISNKMFTYRSNPEGKIVHFLSTGTDLVIRSINPGYKEYRETWSLRGEEFSPVIQRTLKLEKDRRFEVAGTITDKATGDPLRGVQVRVMGSKEEIVMSDANGSFRYELKENENYTLVVEKKEYQPEVIRVSTTEQDEPVTYNLNVEMRRGKFTFVQGFVNQAASGQPVDSVEITISESKTGKVRYKGFTRTDGMFWASVDTVCEFLVTAMRGDLASQRYDITPAKPGESQSTVIHLDLANRGKKEEEIVKTLLYDENKYTLNEKNMIDVQVVGLYMKDNPNTIVEIRSHTDAQGPAHRNLNLSQYRAQTVAKYIEKMGIEKTRLVAKGMGETQPRNECGEGVPCSPDKHQENRRTEIRVVHVQK